MFIQNENYFGHIYHSCKWRHIYTLRFADKVLKNKQGPTNKKSKLFI